MKIPSIFVFLAGSLPFACHSAEPEKLISLRSSYDAAVSRATTPIRNTYLSELQKLKVELTRAAKLEEALAVDAEIKKLSGTSDVASNATELDAAPQGKSPVGERWTRATGMTYDFVSDGTFLTTGKDTPIESASKGTWKLLPDGRYQIEGEKGGVKYFVMTDRKVGKLIETNGTEITLVFDSKLK